MSKLREFGWVAFEFLVLYGFIVTGIYLVIEFSGVCK